MKLAATIVLSCFALFACTKEKVEEKHNCGCVLPPQYRYYKATVIQVSDFTCYKPVLDFSEDSVQLRAYLGVKDLIYNVTNLADSNIVLNKKLYVRVNKLESEDSYICNTMGIPLPALKAVDAKPRN